MPITPPPDNKQEQISETPDATWGDFVEPYYPSDEQAGAALRRLMEKMSALRKREDFNDLDHFSR